ncbi:MAG TPA: Uma2 family endonuclease [Gemmataceae bacterium]|jgi:Uma2 family endonuclease
MSATTTTKKLMTAEEFCDWVHQPEQADKWFELVRGEVIELPSPTKPHGTVCIRVGSALMAYADQRGFGYVTCNDSGVILERDPDTVRGPDVALYEDANTFAELHPKYGEVPPRLAVEVLSPNDRANKVLRKINDYLRCGVGLVWVIDPEIRTVTVHQPGKPQIELTADQEVSGEDVLPGFRCRVADFFALPGDRAKQAAPPG